MGQDSLFKKLCNHEMMLAGWHFAHGDSRDNFVLDPVSYIDFASNLAKNLKHLIEQVQAHRYRPRHLIDIDLPKSGLSVRPGNVLPIEESLLLHAIICLLAPIIDKRLSASVYSYRLHPDWKNKIKKGNSIFRENNVELPFLRRETIRSISPFESWYERWPEFEKAARMSTQEGYTHLTKTDITAYFENIDLRLLETQIRSLIRREEDKIIQLLFRILDGWTRMTSVGSPIGRGIPQGNDVSSFLGNIYLIPLDHVLIKFAKKHDAKWFRYADDVKVFTRSEEDARKVIFVINDALRALHLNLQGSKTAILSGKDLIKELDNSDQDEIEVVFDKIKKIDPSKAHANKKITEQLRQISRHVKFFRRNPKKVVKKFNARQNRIFRRLMTVYGYCGRPRLQLTAIAALKELPDLRILEKSLTYLSQLEYRTHTGILKQLFEMIEKGQLPFPYQIGSVLETVASMHPHRLNDVVPFVRKYTKKDQHWFVVQKGIEAIASFPCSDDVAYKLSQKCLQNDHSLVRRAACVLLLRSQPKNARKVLNELIYHPDSNTSHLALYFLKLSRDKQFASQELSRMARSKQTDFILQRNLPALYALATSEEADIAKQATVYMKEKFKTHSKKLIWHRDKVSNLLNWANETAEVRNNGV